MVKYGARSFLLWGCFAASGTDIMDSVKYQDILEKNERLSVHKLNLCDDWRLQQDNDPKHTVCPSQPQLDSGIAFKE